MTVPVGTYDVTVAAFGYATGTVAGVAVADGAHRDRELRADRRCREPPITGTVTDGSGHGWPLYATITVDGVPGGPVFTDPAPGTTASPCRRAQTYTLHVTPVYPGYQHGRPRRSTLGTTDTSAERRRTGRRPGLHRARLRGALHRHDRAVRPRTTAPAGWTVANDTGTTAAGSSTTPATGATSPVAPAASPSSTATTSGSGNSQDTDLTAPAADFTAATTPVVSFDTDYRGFRGQSGRRGRQHRRRRHLDHVCGQHRPTRSADRPTSTCPCRSAAGKSGVQVRFHFTASFGWWWELDNVFVGNRTCDPVPGGLVVGAVTDANTGNGRHRRRRSPSADATGDHGHDGGHARTTRTWATASTGCSPR